jgi:hypothetical protein
MEPTGASSENKLSVTDDLFQNEAWEPAGGRALMCADLDTLRVVSEISLLELKLVLVKFNTTVAVEPMAAVGVQTSTL